MNLLINPHWSSIKDGNSTTMNTSPVLDHVKDGQGGQDQFATPSVRQEIPANCNELQSKISPEFSPLVILLVESKKSQY